MSIEDSTETLRGYTTALLIAVCTTVGVFFVLMNYATPIRLIVSEMATSCLLLVAMRYLLNRAGERWTGRLSVFVIPLLIAIPFFVERISREMLHAGLPLEGTSMCALRNLTFLPFLFPQDRRSQCAGVAVSLLWVLSVYLQDQSLATSIVVFAYSVLGTCWLIGWHWMKFQPKAPSRSQRQIPRSAKLSVIGATLACATIALISLRSTTSTTAIAGFMPSSGGNRWSDPYAFGGIGDGDQMVEANESASSLGPIESDLFLESTMPSIYDVFNDLYQEPADQPNKTTRAIPLDPSEVQSNHDQLAKNEVASREFAATRRKSQHDSVRDLKDVRSNALFYVQGRVPVHLRHDVYNFWDGTSLRFRGEACRRELTLVDLEESVWLQCGELPSADVSSHIETHVIRIAQLNTPRVPSPANQFVVSLDKLHTAKLFKWTNDGMLRFAGGHLPRMTIIHTRSNPPSRKAVEALCLSREEPNIDPALDPLVVSMLRMWTAGDLTDWECIKSVVVGIQETCQLDSTALIETTEVDVVNDFLLEERRGPDYLFAISTARLLRALGFQTHVVSGFYARAENYSRASGQTAVYPEDVHFWVEVKAEDNSWVTVEPTPGYHVQFARRSALEQFNSWVHQSLAVIWPHRFATFYSVTALITLWIFRRNVYAYGVQCWWRLPLPRTDRAVVRSSVAVLEAYASLGGRQRRPNITIEEWLRTVVERSGEMPASLTDEFRRLVQWSLYASLEQDPTSKNPRQVCRDVLHRCQKRL